MAATTFDTAFHNLLGWEGGYGDNAKDPGGPTCYGVIQAEYDAYRKSKGLAQQSVKHISLAEAEDIYRNQYWNETNCDQINPGVADAVFDADVNSGDRRGVQWLQEAINQISGHQAVTVDGQCGAATVSAANALDTAKLIDAMLVLRLAFMKVARNPKTGARLWNTFGTGWSARINGVRVQAHKLAGVTPTDHPILPLPQPVSADGSLALPAGGAVPSSDRTNRGTVMNMIMLKLASQWALNRLGEGTTWAGIWASLHSSYGIYLNPQIEGNLSNAGMLIIGAIMIGIKEGWHQTAKA